MTKNLQLTVIWGGMLREFKKWISDLLVYLFSYNKLASRMVDWLIKDYPVKRSNKYDDDEIF